MCCRAPHFSHAQNKKADPVRSVSTAAARFVSSSRATRSPTAARQSSTELSGLDGLNTSDVCRSKPVVGKAEKTQSRRVFSISIAKQNKWWQNRVKTKAHTHHTYTSWLWILWMLNTYS